MTLLCHWPLSIFDHGEQQLVNNGERRWFGGKVKGRAHAWSAKNCTLWKNLLSFSTSLPFDSLDLSIGLQETKMRRKPFLRSHLFTSRLITRVSQSSFLYFYKISQKKVFSVSSVEGGLRWLVAWKLKKKSRLKASLWRRVRCLQAALTPWPKYNWWCHILSRANSKAVCFDACNCARACSIICSQLHPHVKEMHHQRRDC